MRNVRTPVLLVPRSSALSVLAAGGNTVFMPLVGSGTTAAVSGITIGNTTRFAATGHGLMKGQPISVAGVNGATWANTTFTVSKIDGPNAFYVDFDSTGLAAYTSGGTISATAVRDLAGVLPVTVPSGTVSGLWANPAYGLTAHTAGNYIKSALVNPLLEFSGATGMLIASMMVTCADDPSTDEYLFSIGGSSANAAGGRYGWIGLHLSGAGGLPQPRLRYRNSSAADNPSDANQLLAGSGFALNTPAHIALLLRFNADLSVNAYVYTKGNAGGMATYTQGANGTGFPGGFGSTFAFTFGGRLNVVGGVEATLGSAATPSGAKIRNFLLHRTSSVDLGAGMAAVQDLFLANGEPGPKLAALQ